jgi:hypothetical protein
VTQSLRHQGPLVRLAAMNVLDRFGPNAAPALPEIRSAAINTKDPVAVSFNPMVDYVPRRNFERSR